MQYTSLSHNDQIPLIGLDTWNAESGKLYSALRNAIQIGYRHIDCASSYGNEAKIGTAIRDAIRDKEITRSELFITSKLWSNCHGKDQVQSALKKSLQDLGTDYLNLYLIHWPVTIKPDSHSAQSAEDFLPPSEFSIRETWEAMESACEQGLTHHIGVSNFSIQKLDRLLLNCKHQPEVNQVEHHPLLQQPELIQYCASHKIHVTAFAPLLRPAFQKDKHGPVLLANPVIRSIAESSCCTPAQVLLAWHVQRGISTIPKSVSPARLLENFQAADVKLSKNDMKKIATLNQNYRLVDGSMWMINGSPWTPQSLWDTP